jgi:hypothetical protein
MFRGTTEKNGGKVQEPSVKVTNPRAKRINEDLASMKDEFNRRNIDPDTALVALAKYAEGELKKDPDLRRTHVFSSYRCLLEQRLLPREEITH